MIITAVFLIFLPIYIVHGTYKMCWLAPCYRPENTHKGKSAVRQADLNLLYYSSEEATVNLSEICGKCEVMYSEEVLDSRAKLDEYFRGGQDRFYFTEVSWYFIFSQSLCCTTGYLLYDWLSACPSACLPLCLTVCSCFVRLLTGVQNISEHYKLKLIVSTSGFFICVIIFMWNCITSCHAS